MESGLISNIQRYSLHDGPGIRTTVFLKGCPLRCAWCHNPENLAPGRQIQVVETSCVKCGQCQKVCPRGPGQPDCSLCEACLAACPTGARSVVGKTMTVKELLSDILKDRIFFEDSQGGVTFSGGEPLFQAGFLREALVACRQAGLHTAVDTCGFASWARLQEVASCTSLFLYDLKILDEQRHQDYCGASNRLILDNLRQLTLVHDNIWIRIPLLTGINDRPDELDSMARLVSSLKGIRQVHFLPYHRVGKQKYPRLGQSLQPLDLTPPGDQEVQAAAARFAALGLKTIIGG